MNEYEIMNLMNDIEYGWIDNTGNKYYEVNNDFSSKYVLQSPSEIIENKIGVCWDQVELERYYFSNIDWNIKTYFLVYYDNEKCPTHTFLTYEKDNKFCWFEHSWEKYKGIHEYSSIKDLLFDVRSKFIKDTLNNNFDKDNFLLREYTKPKEHISVQKFYKHCEEKEPVHLDERSENNE